jgi:hypothetical protein
MLLTFYAIVVVFAALYLVLTEEIFSGSHNFVFGGRDIIFSFYDVTIILVFVVATTLCYISTKAFMKKNSERLLFVAVAFFAFSVKSGLKLIDNHVVGTYDFMGISIQTLELLILLSLFFALLRK